MKGWFCFPSTQLKIHIEADPAFLIHIEQSGTRSLGQFATELPLAPQHEAGEFLVNANTISKKQLPAIRKPLQWLSGQSETNSASHDPLCAHPEPLFSVWRHLHAWDWKNWGQKLSCKKLESLRWSKGLFQKMELCVRFIFKQKNLPWTCWFRACTWSCTFLICSLTPSKQREESVGVLH